MSINTELVVQALGRSPQGLTPFEILDRLIEDPQYKDCSKPSLFSKLLPKLHDLRDSQVIVHIPPRWVLIEPAKNAHESNISANFSSQPNHLADSEIKSTAEITANQCDPENNSKEIFSEVILKILKRSPKGFTPFEILDEILAQPTQEHQTRIDTFVKIIDTLENLRDSQAVIHISPRWVSVESVNSSSSVSKLEPVSARLIEGDIEPIKLSSNIEYSENIRQFKNQAQHDQHTSNELTHPENSGESTQDLNDSLVIFFDSPIELLRLSLRTFNCLKRTNVNTVEELQNLSEIDLINIKNFGQKSLNEVRTILSKIRPLPKLTKTKSEISVEHLPEWARIQVLQIPTYNLIVSPSLRQVISQYPTIAHLIFAFEAAQISLDSRQRAELIPTINPFLELRNAPKNYLDWLSCLPISIFVEILAKHQWTPDKLSEVCPRQILSVTPPNFRQAIYQDIISGKIPSKRFLTISEEIKNVFCEIDERQMYVLQQRLGLQDGQQRSLEVIGQELGLTRERVRQIEKKAKDRLNDHAEISLLPQLTDVAIKSLYSVGCITTLQNWTEAIEQLYPAGEIHLPSVISWFVEFIGEIHTFKIADTQLFYIDPVSRTILSNIQSQISEFWEEQKISDRSQLYQVIMPLLPEELDNPEKAANVLIDVFCQEPLPDVFSSSKWKMKDYAYYALHEAGKPLHFTEVSKRIKQLKPDWKAENTERAGQGLIDNHPDIIRSGSGIYGLREWGTMEYSHFREVLLDHLSKQTLPVDADVMHENLSQVYAVSLPTVKMTLAFHPNLFQKFGRSNFYGLKGRLYELPDQTLINLLVAKLEAQPVSLVELKQDSDLREYTRDIIYLYLNVSPLFWQVGSLNERKFALSVDGKRQYQQGDGNQIVANIFEQIREPLHIKDFLRLTRVYYAYPPGESAFSRILAEDKSYLTIAEGVYIPRAWMDDENLSPTLEDLDRELCREVIQFTVGSKRQQPPADLLFDWLNFCYRNRFFYRGSLIFEQLNLGELSEKEAPIARKIGQVCQRNGDISSLSFGQDTNSEEVDRNLRLDLEELRQQAKSGQRLSTQGLATLADGKYYVRYAEFEVEVHIEKWGGDTNPQMRVLQVLYKGDLFDPSKHNPILNTTPLEKRLEAMQKIYAATLTAYGQVDPYLQIAIGSRPTWGGVGYRNLKPIMGETT